MRAAAHDQLPQIEGAAGGACLAAPVSQQRITRALMRAGRPQSPRLSGVGLIDRAGCKIHGAITGSADGRRCAMLELGTAGWVVTIAVIVGWLARDLLLAAVRPHAAGYREAVAWSIFYIAVATAFGIVFAWQAGGHFGTQYFAGYIVEKSLSVDNLFVFVII